MSSITFDISPIYVILGKCCSGKDTAAREMESKHNINFVISTTTRPMRAGESEGNPYHFITNEEFERKISNGELIEYREYIRNGEKWYYGVTKDQIEDSKCYVAVLDIVGLREFRKKFGNRVVPTYIDVPEEERKRRCIERGDYDGKEWELREQSDNAMFTEEVIKEIGHTIYWNNL